LQPELTHLFLVAVQEQGHSFFLLRVDLPLEFGVPEAAASMLCYRSAAAKEIPGVVKFEENTLPVVVLGVPCYFIFCSSFVTPLTSLKNNVHH
jgi:hypothetical protein